jgi:hypothetical protein
MNKKAKKTLKELESVFPFRNDSNCGIIMCGFDENEEMELEREILKKYPNLMTPSSSKGKKGTVH